MACTKAHADCRDKIRSYGQQKGFDPDFVEAVSTQEGANGDGGVGHLLDGVKYRWTIVDVKQWAHGPMQIRPGAIKDVLDSRGISREGFFSKDNQGREYAPSLLTPMGTTTNLDMAIEFGIDYLALMRDKYCKGLSDGQLNECTAAKYNGGPHTGRDSAGRYTNQGYANGVANRLLACTGKSFGDAPAVRNQPESPGPVGGGPGGDPPPGGGPGGPGPGGPGPNPPPAGGDGVCKTQAVPMVPYPIPPNPYLAYFSIVIFGPGRVPGANQTPTETPEPPNFTPVPVISGGVTLTPARPQYITYFELSETGGTTECRVKIFDPNWDRSQQIAEMIQLTEEIVNDQVYRPAFLHEAKISFGYVADKYPKYFGNDIAAANGYPVLWSETYSMMVQSFHPEFLAYGVEIEFVFYGKGSGYQNLQNKTLTYRKPIADASDVITREDGTVGPGDKTIVGEICQERNWDLCCTSTERVMQPGAALATAVPDDRAFLRDNKGAATFIKDEIIPMCAVRGARDTVSGKLNRGDYRLWMEENSPDRRPRLHIHDYTWNKETVRSYTYAKQRYGAIISFKPDVMGAALAAMGSVQAETRGYDIIDKKWHETNYVLDDVKTSGNFSSGNLVDESKLTGDEKLVKVYPSVTTYPSQTEIEGLNYWQKARHFCNQAELQIIGDPLIKIGSVVEVKVLNFFELEDGRFQVSLSYVSGNWLVNQIRHIIQSGEYLTVLDLLRNDSLISSQAAPLDEATPPDGNVDGEDSAFFNNNPNNIVT